jgi:hypothetical protein
MVATVFYSSGTCSQVYAVTSKLSMSAAFSKIHIPSKTLPRQGRHLAPERKLANPQVPAAPVPGLTG